MFLRLFGSLNSAFAATMDHIEDVDDQEALRNTVMKNLDTGEQMTLDMVTGLFVPVGSGGSGSGDGGGSTASSGSPDGAKASTRKKSGRLKKLGGSLRKRLSSLGGKKKDGGSSKGSASGSAGGGGEAVPTPRPQPHTAAAAHASAHHSTPAPAPTPIIRPAPLPTVPGQAIDMANVPSFHYNAVDNFEPEVWEGD